MSADTTTKRKNEDKVRIQATAKNKPIPEKKTAGGPPGISETKNTSEERSGSLDLILDSVLVINNANDLYAQFASFLGKNNKELVIDASSVEMIDTAILQLLYALVSGLKLNNVDILWRSPSAEFISRSHSLGLSEIFGLDSLTTE